MRSAVAFTLLLAASLMTGCASQPAPSMSTHGSTVVQPGRVTSVRDITVRGERPSGLGAFAGAVLGSVAGSRIGSGYGSTAASIGGAVAGGMAGQHIEQSTNSSSATEVTVQFDSGESRTFQVEPGMVVRVGDTVNVTTSGGVTRIRP